MESRVWSVESGVCRVERKVEWKVVKRGVCSVENDMSRVECGAQSSESQEESGKENRMESGVESGLANGDWRAKLRVEGWGSEQRVKNEEGRVESGEWRVQTGVYSSCILRIVSRVTRQIYAN